MSNFTLHAEAACCIWEALLERRTRDDAEPDGISVCFAERGTNEMRHAAIALSVLCSDLWHSLSDDERPDCFDWDFVPRFVDMLTWDPNTCSLVEIPDLAKAREMYAAYCAKGG